MEFSRPEYWSGLPFPSPRDLPDPGIKSGSSAFQADALPSEPPCNPMDCGLPGSSVHGILQARILKWVAIPFSGDLCDPGVEPRSPTLQTDSLPTELRGKPWKDTEKCPNDLRINPRRRYNNYKYICTQHRSTAICKTDANKYERGN